MDPEGTPAAVREPIVWHGFEHQHEEKSVDWYWALAVIAVSAALISLLFANVLFALLIVVAAVTLAMLARKEPEIAEFEITDRELRIDDVRYPYTSISAFWIEETDEDRATLLIDTTKFMAPHLVIPIEDVDPEEVRARLSQHVEEIELVEPLSHRLLELLGF